MGYWPKSVKRRRHNWVTELGRKLVLVGCTGHHEVLVDRRTRQRYKAYVLNRPGYEGGRRWADTEHFKQVQTWGRSEDSVTVKGARMMEII